MKHTETIVRPIDTYWDLKEGLDIWGIQALIFSGGEPHIKIPDYNESEHLCIKADIHTMEEWMFFCTLLSTVAQKYAIHGNLKELTLYIPYFPGARQDRSDGNSPLTVEMYAGMLAGSLIAFEGNLHVYTFDMHSEEGFNIVVATLADIAMGVNQSAISMSNIRVNQLNKDDFDEDITHIIAPDAGAVERANLFQQTFFPNAVVLECEKEREFATGRIARYNVPDFNADAGKFLVVDDICDGGATFVMLAEEFYRHPNAVNFELQLYVSHGIFSKTPEVLEDAYSKIYTTDSFPHVFYDQDYPFVKILRTPDAFIDALLKEAK